VHIRYRVDGLFIRTPARVEVAELNTVAGPPEQITQWNTSTSRTVKSIKLPVSSARLDTGRWPMAASTSGRYEVCMRTTINYIVISVKCYCDQQQQQ
jgi:hypothetical protein